MKRGESGPEESLDDILASIRKIIADEPGQTDVSANSEPAFAATSSPDPRAAEGVRPSEPTEPRSMFGAAAPSTSGATMPAPVASPANGVVGIQLPSARDALSGASALPTKPAPSERSGGFGFFRAALSAQTEPAPAAPLVQTGMNGSPADSQAPARSIAASIDDELADLIDEPALAQPPFERAPAPELPQTSFSARETAPSVEAAREKWSQLINPSQSAGAEPPRSAAPVPAAPTVSAPTSGIFAPRSGGFYPPQAKAEPAPVKSTPAPRPASDQPVPPPAVAGSELAVTADPVHQAAEQASPPAAIVPPSGTPASEPPISARLDTLAASNPTAAAAAALDALALGLAKTEERAAQTAQPALSPMPADTLIGSTLAAQPAAASAPAPVSAIAPATAPASASESVSAPPAAATAQPRTLEDVVADMVRPMLEKWIDENMPRIVERALKLDATTGPKT